MKICIIDRSYDPEVTYELLVRIAAAIEVQVARDVAGWWEVQPVPLAVAVTAPPGFDQCLITKTLDDPEAVAYHTRLANGRPLLRVGLDAVRAQGGNFVDELSKSLSHEILEAIMNPYVNWWGDWKHPGKKCALEICDPCQGDAYDIDGVKVSNFVGPRWFRPGQGPYDYMKTLVEPWQIAANGYVAYDDGSQTFGENVSIEKQELITKLGRMMRNKTA